MDTITHIVSGAVIGELAAGKQLGKKAMVIGALTQCFPDIDVFASLWLQPVQNLLAHRGITHSFLFVFITSAVLGFAFSRWFKKISLPHWIFFLGAEMLVHILLDSLTTYGTGWLEPFSSYRVSFHSLFIADPFYTVWLLIAFLLLLIIGGKKRIRGKIALYSLAISTFYLGYAAMNKRTVMKMLNQEISSRKIETTRSMITPAPLNSWLWYAIAESNNGYYTGYYSVFDKNSTGHLNFIPRNDSLLKGHTDETDLKLLMRFANGYYSVTLVNDTLVFNDLRFGQVAGWENPDAPFVFYYFLQYPSENELVVQRGRFARADKNAFQSLIERIKGI